MLCDIMDMISCYIFLGKPWQYDSNVVHYYVKNVFIVEKGGGKFSLIPLYNEELGRRNLSFGSQVEITDFEMVRD